jgi:hypothetical protein
MAASPSAQGLLTTNWRELKHSSDVRKFADSIDAWLVINAGASSNSATAAGGVSETHKQLVSLVENVKQHLLVLELNESLLVSVSSLKEFERSIDTYCDSSSQKLFQALENSVSSFHDIQR